MYSATWARTTRFSNMGPKPKICIQGMDDIFIGFVSGQCSISATLVSGPRYLSWLQHYMFVFRPTLPVRARPSHIWFPTQVASQSSFITCLVSGPSFLSWLTIFPLESGSSCLSWLHHLPFGFGLRWPVMDPPSPIWFQAQVACHASRLNKPQILTHAIKTVENF